MQKSFAMLFLLSFSLVGADTGYMADLGKTLPQGVWRLDVGLRNGAYGVIAPATTFPTFKVRQQTVVGKFCFGVLSNLEVCGEAPWQKTSSDSSTGPIGWAVKYSPLYHSYYRGEILATVSYQGWAPSHATYPTSAIIPGNAGTATFAYGMSHQGGLTVFASKNRFAGQAFGSYRANIRRDYFRPGNSACGGGTLFVSPQDIKAENKVSFAADAWLCQQQNSEYAGKPFSSQGQISAVGPAIIYTHGPKFGIKAAFGIWTKKPKGLISYDPNLNGDGFSLSVWFRK